MLLVTGSGRLHTFEGTCADLAGPNTCGRMCVDVTRVGVQQI